MKQKDTEKQNGLLPLYSDIVFKIFCIKKPHLLARLLDAVLGFKGSDRIESLQILNPEIPGDTRNDKLSILDIHAVNKRSEHFGVEMQGFPQDYFGKRVLYYWAKLYSQQIKKGATYVQLKPVYSVSFLNFNLLQIDNFHSTFQLLEKENPEIALTKDLEIHIIELPKFLKQVEELDTELENWLYFLGKAEHLQEKEMKELQERNPVMEEAIEALKDISLDDKTRAYYEMRLKSERDFMAMRHYAYHEGLKKGVEQGIQEGKEEERLLAEKVIEKERKRAEHKKALRTAIKMKHAGSSLDFISEMTELPKAYLEKFFKKAVRD